MFWSRGCRMHPTPQAPRSRGGTHPSNLVLHMQTSSQQHHYAVRCMHCSCHPPSWSTTRPNPLDLYVYSVLWLHFKIVYGISAGIVIHHAGHLHCPQCATVLYGGSDLVKVLSCLPVTIFLTPGNREVTFLLTGAWENTHQASREPLESIEAFFDNCPISIKCCCAIASGQGKSKWPFLNVSLNKFSMFQLDHISLYISPADSTRRPGTTAQQSVVLQNCQLMLKHRGHILQGSPDSRPAPSYCLLLSNDNVTKLNLLETAGLPWDLLEGFLHQRGLRRTPGEMPGKSAPQHRWQPYLWTLRMCLPPLVPLNACC